MSENEKNSKKRKKKQDENKVTHEIPGKFRDLVSIFFYFPSLFRPSFPELIGGQMISHINLHFSRYQRCKTGFPGNRKEKSHSKCF